MTNPGKDHGDGGPETRSRCTSLFTTLKEFFKKDLFLGHRFRLIGNGTLEGDYFFMANADFVICDKSFMATYASRANIKGRMVYLSGNTKGGMGSTEAFGTHPLRHSISYGNWNENQKHFISMGEINNEEHPLSVNETAKWIMTHR